MVIYEGFSAKARQRHGGEAAPGDPAEAVYPYPGKLIAGDAASGEALVRWCREYAEGRLEPLWRRDNFAESEDL